MSDGTFAQFGPQYQEKIVQALFQDFQFGEQMMDVLEPKYFDLEYLKEIVSKFYRHRKEYKTFPSSMVVDVMAKSDPDLNGALRGQISSFLPRLSEPLNGDMKFIQASSLDFCKRQIVKEAMIQAIDRIESQDYDSIQKILKDALGRGVSHDLGHDYLSGLSARGERSVRSPVPTGWPVLNKVLNGGWERGTLATFIAPTGAGKSMFLTNCSAAAIANGLNSLYVTCEMADFKIGLRHDAYFSGISINDVPQNVEKVQGEIDRNVKGRLYIKEFPTKTATVQTIRNYIQRLASTKGFMPDVVVIDYADLLRTSRGYGEKRFELEAVYEELRALAQELNVVMITADQTNRAGLEMEVVTIAQIGEAYSKATVCDLIMTISRRMEDKQTNSGRLFVAKSRLGGDGMVFPFLLNTATVKVSILDQGVDPITQFLNENSNLQEKMGERFQKLNKQSAAK